MATCFFIGHRDAKNRLLPALIAEVERHILEYDVTEFVVGRYGRFDGLAAQAVKQTKERHPNVNFDLSAALPPGGTARRNTERL